jgi:hypothetical protein
MKKEEPLGFWRSFVRFITFIDLPIKRKFTVFGIGTLFWFIMIGTVAVGSLVFIHFRYSQISQITFPYTQLVQSISPEVEGLSRAVSESYRMTPGENIPVVTQHLQRIRTVVSNSLIERKEAAASGNFFEALNYSLAQKDAEGLHQLQSLLEQVKEIEGTLV